MMVDIQDGNTLYQYLKQREELSYMFNKVYALCHVESG